MVDLNLLPEEMRKIEEQKKRDAEKKPPVFEVKLSIPEDEKSDDLKMKGGVFSGVFKRKEKPMPPPPIIPVQKKIDEKNIPGSARGNDFMPRQLPVVHTPDSLVRGEIHIAPPIQGQPVKKPQAPEMKIPIKPELKKTIVLESAPLQIASKKKSGFWAWLKSLFVRRKKEKIYFPKIDKKPELPKLSDIKPLLPELPIKTLEIKKPITPLPPPALMKTQTPPPQEPEIFTFPISEQKKEALLLLLQVPSLKEWRKDNLNLRKERHQLELQATDKALNMKLDDAQYRLEHFIQQTEHLRQEISFLEDQIGEQMTFQQKLMGEFGKSALEILGKEIEIQT